MGSIAIPSPSSTLSTLSTSLGTRRNEWRPPLGRGPPTEPMRLITRMMPSLIQTTGVKMGMRMGIKGEGCRRGSPPVGLYGSCGVGRACVAMMMYCSAIGVSANGGKREVGAYGGEEKGKDSGVGECTAPHAERSRRKAC